MGLRMAMGRCVRLLRLAAPRVRDAALLLALPLAVAASIAINRALTLDFFYEIYHTHFFLKIFCCLLL